MHQHIELPRIVMTVIHFIIYQGKCTACGKVRKGYVPAEYSTGFGARFSALVAEIGGIDGNSRETIRTFSPYVLNVHISLGRFGIKPEARMSIIWTRQPGKKAANCVGCG